DRALPFGARALGLRPVARPLAPRLAVVAPDPAADAQPRSGGGAGARLGGRLGLGGADPGGAGAAGPSAPGPAGRGAGVRRAARRGGLSTGAHREWGANPTA